MNLSTTVDLSMSKKDLENEGEDAMQGVVKAKDVEKMQKLSKEKRAGREDCKICFPPEEKE